MSFTLLYLRGSVDWPGSGSIQINGQPLIRTYQLNPVDPDYQDRVTDNYPGRLPPQLVRSTDFRSGQIRAYFPYPQPFIARGKPTTFSGGRIHLLRPTIQATGGLTDFAAFPPAAIDPREFLLESATALASGAVGAAWTRHSAIFEVARGSQATNTRVAFIGVGAKFSGVAADERQYIAAVQVERAPIGDNIPSTFSQAREVRVYVRPDRLNYSDNPAYAVDVSNWARGTTNAGAITISRQAVAGVALFGAAYLQFAVALLAATVPVATITTTLTGLLPNRWYTWSNYVFNGANLADVVVLSGPANLYRQVAYADNVFLPGRPDWRRIAYSFYVGDTTTQAITVQITGSTSGASVTARLDGALLEAGEELRDFFDGGYGADYMWMASGTTGRTKSFYYLNRAERNAAIKRLLAANVPLGIGYTDPFFGAAPTE